MSIYIPLCIFGLILSALFYARLHREQIDSQERMLKLVSTDTEYLISKFNKKDLRETIIKNEDDYLLIHTDIQLFQLTTEGHLQIKLSSEINDVAIKGECWTNINPTLLVDEADSIEPPFKKILFPFTNENLIETLDFFKNTYSINYNINYYEPCFALTYDSLDVNENWKTITYNGHFLDQTKWQLVINYSTFRLTWKSRLESLQEPSNLQHFNV